MPSQGTNLATATGATPYQEYYLSTPVNGNNDVTLGRAYITLTSAQILALNTTPITVIPAPGAGQLIQVDNAVLRLNFNTTAYTGTNAIQFSYTNGSGAVVTASPPASFLNSVATAFYCAPDAAVLAVVNAPVVVSVPTANPAAGNSTLSIEVFYSIRNLNA